MNANPAMESARTALLRQLQSLLGVEHVVTDPAECEVYSTDIYRRGETAMAVVRPGSSADVAQIVQLSAAAGVAVVPRGGGASYTDGYAPAERESILIDTSRMNRILELNERDGYVVVEVGVTWATLNEALAAKGLRTPFFGPFSGLAATVGGSLSQNSVTWGTGVFGVSGETTLCVEVVLGDGRLVRTGSWGAANGVPFMRSYGPDLTGLFMGDCGVIPDPNAEQIAEIAISTAQLAHHLLGITPRVAMLSFSTKGSSTHPSIGKMKAATALAESKAKAIKQSFAQKFLAIIELSL